MLKLLKYELIGSYRQYLTTFIIYIILCCATPFLPDFIRDLVSGILIAAVFGIIITVFVNIITHYSRSMFSRPGYLTLTLPVSSKELVLSKMIGSMIWSIVAFFILGLGLVLLVMFVSGANLNEVWQLINLACYAISRVPVETLLLFISILTSTLVSIATLYFVITFVNTKYVTKNRVLIGILIYVAGSLVFSAITNSSILASITVNFNMMQTFTFINIASILGAVAFFFGTTYLIDNKLQID